ncbi:uncharacterized protein BJ171DRAFT_599081 [Polychytrium aggregatum]|uniref:uncharacterized protein n=1 Tax=Polychytrium aggregatum TaxID=110093 RepID=UPI0022FE659B|nr:uncharacterized protein BJ171DRAFT_599081 [Polychytrium aggregatum]KAI9204676.1 hypothetical protein BJ171DRAFT_599081 [Polychytrium aggregatum]
MAVDITQLVLQTIRERSRTQSALENGAGPLEHGLIFRKPLAARTDFMKEAYKLSRHIVTLQSFLAKIQRTYLDIHRHLPRASDGLAPCENDPLFNSGDSGLFLQTMLGLESLTDRQRDEIDAYCKVFIQSTIKSIDLLKSAAEQLSKGPSSLSVAKSTSLFGSLLSTEEEKADELRHLNEHRQAVIWSLQKRLQRASQLQMEMQEARLKRKLNSSASYASPLPTPTQTSQGNTASEPTKTSSYGISKLGQTLEAALGSFKPRDETPVKGYQNTPDIPSFIESDANIDDDEDFESTLSDDQRLMFERENEALLSQLENETDQVRTATRTIQEIASLTNQLGHHLQEQQEMIEGIYEEAQVATSYIQRGNEHLEKAQRHFGDARIWVLVFLLVASGVLLFLDWYDS